MIDRRRIIYHCSTGRLAAWAAALHLGGLTGDVERLRPMYKRWKDDHLPGSFVMIGQDQDGCGVYAWQSGHSLPILTKAFRCFDEIFSIGQDQWLFISAELPGLSRLGMVAMVNAFTDYSDIEILRWARPHLERTVQAAVIKLRRLRS